MPVAAAPPAVVQIAQRVQSQESGIVVYRLHRVFDVHAGPMRRHDELTLAIAAQDGNVVRVRVLQASVGGKTPDAAGLAQIESQYEHPKPEDLFHRPFDVRYLAEYSYREVDAQTYAFTSAVRDSSHGDGTFKLDPSGDVVQYSYAPNALPQYTNRGTVTNIRTQVLPGYWALTRESHEYSGHYAIFGGGATVLITFDDFRRCPDLASAFAALQSFS